MMEQLKVNFIEPDLPKKLVRIGDFDYYDGPFLTLFYYFEEKGFYLVDWVDDDDVTNRWLIYRVTPYALQRYIHKEITRYELFASNEGEIYIADIKSGEYLPQSKFCAVRIEDVPVDYLPPNDAYFEPSLARDLGKIESAIRGSMSAGQPEKLFDKALQINLQNPQVEKLMSYLKKLTSNIIDNYNGINVAEQSIHIVSMASLPQHPVYNQIEDYPVALSRLTSEKLFLKKQNMIYA